jgi:hypothetical protein
MTTVVQTRYRPQIQPALVGMIADEAGSEVGTRQCETAAGIAFGLAVSQGTNDKGAVIGGSAFIGISVRDVTLDGSPIDPLGDRVAGTLDIYPQYSNMGVISRGHIWVEAEANVRGGDAAFYDTTSGKFSNSASGAAARGYIDFSIQPADAMTVVINGKTWTFKSSGAGAAQTNIGPTITDSVTALAASLNASADGLITPGSYLADGNRLWVAWDAVGVAGNAIAITSGTTTGATASAATLAGGTAAATAVSGAFWLSSAVAGQLAKVSLGIQR